MVSGVQSAVAIGEYASSSEVIRDAVGLDIQTQTLDIQTQTLPAPVGNCGTAPSWLEPLHDKTPSIAAADVLNCLERKIPGYRRCRRIIQLELSRLVESDLDDIANYNRSG